MDNPTDSRFGKLQVQSLFSDSLKSTFNNRKIISLIVFFCIIIILVFIKPSFVYSTQKNTYKTKKISYIKLTIISLILSFLFYFYPQIKQNINN
jgi:Na+/melibiose symporter-like transporter